MRHTIIWQRKFADPAVLVIRVVVGLMFLWSSLPKIRQPYEFLGNVLGYRVVGRDLSVFAAVTIPWLELLLAACLIGGLLTRAAFMATAILALLFTAANAWVVHQGINVSCGCFGNGGPDSPVTYWTVGRSLLLAVGAAGSYAVLSRSRQAIAGVSSAGEVVQIKGKEPVGRVLSRLV
jgi:uncharacterized membrane protein YphA (DoxX/SURF4 family)